MQIELGNYTIDTCDLIVCVTYIFYQDKEEVSLEAHMIHKVYGYFYDVDEYTVKKEKITNR